MCCTLYRISIHRRYHVSAFLRRISFVMGILYPYLHRLSHGQKPSSRPIRMGPSILLLLSALSLDPPSHRWRRETLMPVRFRVVQRVGTNCHPLFMLDSGRSSTYKFCRYSQGKSVVSPLSAKRFFKSQQPLLDLPEETNDKDK